MFLLLKKFSDIKQPEAVVNRVETELVPKLRELPGFISFYTVKFDNGDHGSVGIYESREDLNKALNQSENWVKQNLTQNVTSEPMILRGEVLSGSVGKTIAKTA